MSVEQEVAGILADADDSSTASALSNIRLALQGVDRMLSATSSSMFDLCTNIEGAKSRGELKTAFTQFNAVVRMFLEAAPRAEHDKLVREALCSVRLSERLKVALQAAASVPEALAQCKLQVVTELAEVLRAQDALSQLDDKKDDELLLRLLPEPCSPLSEGDPQEDADDAAQVLADVGGPSKKRGFSAIDAPSRVSYRGAIPALASISRMQQLVDHGCASKKQALMTREKLRAGMHDPRGLLRMVSSSTNALERAKKLEILKSSGFVFDEDTKSQGKTSFADRLSMATTRLELGLGGHTLSDTLLFGARVLSTPGVLSPKNIIDIENNIVDGKTT